MLDEVFQLSIWGILTTFLQILNLFIKHFLKLTEKCADKTCKHVTMLDHEITLKILEFILNSIEKVKLGFLLSLMCMFPESNGTKS